MSVMMPIEPGNRIQVPAEWLAEMKVREKVILERTPAGIVIRPAPLTWDEVFANKLTVGEVPVEPDIEESKDDLLF